MPPKTATHRLADLLLGSAGPLDRFVAERRSAGVSWRRLVRDLHEATRGEIDVTAETLRAWCPDSHDGQAAS